MDGHILCSDLTLHGFFNRQPTPAVTTISAERHLSCSGATSLTPGQIGLVQACRIVHASRPKMPKTYVSTQVNHPDGCAPRDVWQRLPAYLVYPHTMLSGEVKRVSVSCLPIPFEGLRDDGAMMYGICDRRHVFLDAFPSHPGKSTGSLFIVISKAIESVRYGVCRSSPTSIAVICSLVHVPHLPIR